MENQNVKIETVQINSTCEAVVISPKLTGKMALVDLKTLQRITRYLNIANLGEIKNNLIAQLDSVRTMEEYNEILKQEICFHESVNLIQTIEL